MGGQKVATSHHVVSLATSLSSSGCLRVSQSPVITLSDTRTHSFGHAKGLELSARTHGHRSNGHFSLHRMMHSCLVWLHSCLKLSPSNWKDKQNIIHAFEYLDEH